MSRVAYTPLRDLLAKIEDADLREGLARAIDRERPFVEVVIEQRILNGKDAMLVFGYDRPAMRDTEVEVRLGREDGTLFTLKGTGLESEITLNNDHLLHPPGC